MGGGRGQSYLAMVKEVSLYFLLLTVQPTTEPVKPTLDPCFDQSCTYHAECIVEQGLPKCVCLSNCPNTSSPICGSDGVTYDNDCAMKRESCNKQLRITVSSRGHCGEFRFAVLLPYYTTPCHITPYQTILNPSISYYTASYHTALYHTI